MNILIYTDVHFSQYSSILRSRGEKYSTRLEGIIKSLNAVEEVAKDVDLVISLGDFFDSSSLNAEELSALKEIKWANVPHWFLVGNHELNSVSLEKSSAHVLSLIPNSLVIDCIQRSMMYNTVIYFLPYAFDCSRPLSDIIEEDDKDKNIIVMSHNDIKGIRYGKHFSESGYDFKDIVENCNLFINGHIHDGSEFTRAYSDRGRLINLGNFTGQNFSEDAFQYSHNFMVLNTDTMKYRFEKVPYAFNFYQLDFTNNDEIDYIDMISSSLKNPAVVSVKCYSNDSYNCIRERFDPKYISGYNFPKNCNIIESRFTVVRNECASEDTVEHLEKVEYLERFKEFILGEVGSSDDVLREVNEICK